MSGNLCEMGIGGHAVTKSRTGHKRRAYKSLAGHSIFTRLTASHLLLAYSSRLSQCLPSSSSSSSSPPVRPLGPKPAFQASSETTAALNPHAPFRAEEPPTRPLYPRLPEASIRQEQSDHQRNLGCLYKLKWIFNFGVKLGS
ncbi:hypothetical protein L596_007318 [Steinernema carpocapsae]|uniref:Uncharacterized protein n=1 Tax=Steinernema carpocapsae TaxID=34508 RepID=A0A4U5P9L3_STECR|nr:hypothetical protein L596_007318 [Steinernema carpocapsae]